MTILISFLFSLELLGINRLFRFLNRHKAIILWYHDIIDDRAFVPRLYRGMHLPASIFMKQIAYLKKQGYRSLSMSTLVDKIKNKEDLGKLIVFTFDDGYQQVADIAFPILKANKAAGCVYLVTDNIDKHELLWPDYIACVLENNQQKSFTFDFKGQAIEYKLEPFKWYKRAVTDIKNKLRTLPESERQVHMRQFSNRTISSIPPSMNTMTSEQISTLDPEVLEIGSHTKNHVQCSKLSTEQEYKNEMLESKRYLEKLAGYRIRHFCYPAGAYNDAAVERLIGYGYQSAVSINPGFIDAKSDLFRLQRINGVENLWLFKALTSGSILFAYQIVYWINHKWNQRKGG